MAKKYKAAIEYQQQRDDSLTNIYYLFDIINGEDVTIENEVTQYVTEDGSTLQEHVVQPPITISLEGFVAEKVFRADLSKYASQLAGHLSKLQPIGALLPTVSSYASLAVSATNFIERTVRQTIDKVVNLKKLFSPATTASLKRQTQVIEELKRLRDARTLLTVKSDLGTYENMMIKRIYGKQEETYDQSSITVELIQFTFATTQITTIDTKKYGGRLAEQMASVQDLGRVQGATMSTLRSWVSPNIVPYFTGVGQ